jgi:CheY-like chemotaxis protein
MLSGDINSSVSSILNKQESPSQGEAEPEVKNNFSEQDVLSHAICTPHVLEGDIADLQKFSQRVGKLKIPESSLRRNLFMPLRVLIVDDIPMNQQILRRMLGKQCCCEFASHGKEAIQKHSENNFDIIFMDIEMPVMNGLEATTAIRQQELAQHKRRIPIIASTSLDPVVLDKGITVTAGMDDYIMKPYGEKRVYEIINLYTGKGKRECTGGESAKEERLPKQPFSTRKILRSGSPSRRATSWSEPSEGSKFLVRFHLLSHENSNHLAQDLVSGSDIPSGLSAWRKRLSF